jgi:hypothetical protein
MTWSLVIHDDPDLVQTITKMVADVLGGPVVGVTNFADARAQVFNNGSLNCQLVVSGVSPPSAANVPQPLEGNRPAATAFFREIRAGGDKPPFLFLLRFNQGFDRNEFGDLRAVELLGVNALHDLPQAARQLARNKEARGPRHEVDVDITVSRSGCRWDLSGTGGRVLEMTNGIRISTAELDEILELSECASDANLACIRMVGRRMYQLFMSDHGRGGLALALAENIQSKLEQARFRFHLDHDTNRLLVETLAYPSASNGNRDVQFWMLRTPMLRKFGGSGVRQPLFKDRRSRNDPIDCLIIQGDAALFNASPPVESEFPAIPLAAKEAAWLDNYLRANRDTFGIHSVRLMRPTDYPDGNYGNAVRAALGQCPWKLIHYVGHSAVGTDGQGYLVLGNDRDDLLDIDTFAECAKEVQFVFLNSCTSANAVFIARLVEKSIPAAVGYAWRIKDEVAAKFAKTFYQDLFKGPLPTRFLEYSFMRGKVHLHHVYRDQAAWASPLLFMQTNKAEPDRLY